MAYLSQPSPAKLFQFAAEAITVMGFFGLVPVIVLGELRLSQNCKHEQCYR